MKKSLLAIPLAVLAVSVPLGAALAAGEKPVSVRAGDLIFTVTGNASPKKLPRRGLAPVSFHTSGRIATVDGGHPPALSEVTLDTGKAGTIEADKFPSCAQGRLEATTTEQAKERLRGRHRRHRPRRSRGPVPRIGAVHGEGPAPPLQRRGEERQSPAPGPRLRQCPRPDGDRHPGLDQPRAQRAVSPALGRNDPGHRGRRRLGDLLLFQHRPQGLPDRELQQWPLLRPSGSEVPLRPEPCRQLRETLHPDRLMRQRRDSNPRPPA